MNLKKEADYLEEYHIINTSEKKALSYHGDIFKYKGSESGFFHFKRQILASSVFYSVLWILISALDPVSLRGKGNPLVMLSYVLLLFLVVCSVNAAIRLYRLPACLERKMYDRYIIKPSIYAVLLAIFSATAFAGQIYSMIVNRSLHLNELATALCFLLLFLTGLFSYRLQSRQFFENAGRQG